MEYEPNCLPSCKLDDNDNEISHLQNDFNNENVSNKSVIPADENYIRYGLSESNSSVISNLYLNSYPDEYSYKDKETKSLLSVKTKNNNPKEIDRKKHVMTIITQSSKKKVETQSFIPRSNVYFRHLIKFSL